jgi:hypothetical protein
MPAPVIVIQLAPLPRVRYVGRVLQEKKSWMSLKRSLRVTKWFQTVLLLCVTGVFPVLIAVLANTWTNRGSQSSLAGWFLIFVAFLQVAFGAYVIVSRSVCPEAAMAELLEAEEHLENKTRELARREEAYRLIRASFEQLTSQTCKIGLADSDSEWCKSGFEAGLHPIMETLLRNMHQVVGVRSSVYTVEVYLEGRIQIDPQQDASEEPLKLCFFFGSSVDRGSVSGLLSSKASPAWSAFETNTPFSQHISSNTHLFYDGNVVKAGVYFRYFAATPLHEACSPNSLPIGAFLLTSMQDEPFSADVLDTMAFFASIISTFLYSYQGCLFRRIEAMSQSGAGPGERANHPPGEGPGQSVEAVPRATDPKSVPNATDARFPSAPRH